MKFVVINRKTQVKFPEPDVVYLQIDNWNDYSFVTMFYLSIGSETGSTIDIGNVKIGFKGQTTTHPTYERIESEFDSLSEDFFSLGTELEYYEKLLEFDAGSGFKDKMLRSIRDICFDQSIIRWAKEEQVFNISLLREVSLSAVQGQYVRVLNGGVPLTNFEFEYFKESSELLTEISLDFKIEVNSKPSTNIHALIGRNGVGKTTILNDMVNAVIDKSNSLGQFLRKEGIYSKDPINNEYFSRVVSVSFSAFDAFEPPMERLNSSNQVGYTYIGLRNISEEGRDAFKKLDDLREEFVNSMTLCFRQPGRKKRWIKAIKLLNQMRILPKKNCQV